MSDRLFNLNGTTIPNAEIQLKSIRNDRSSHTDAKDAKKKPGRQQAMPHE